MNLLTHAATVNFRAVQKLVIAPAWEAAITGWINVLTVAGATKETIRNRRGIIRMIAHTLNQEDPRHITTEHLMALAAARTWSNDYRRSYRTVTHQFFGWCIDHNLHPGPNPADGLPKVPESKPRPRPVTDEIWQHLLTAAPPRERLMVRLAGEAGLRRAEVAQVHRNDLIDAADGWSLIVRGKGGKQRVVPITTSLAEAIRTYTPGYTPQGFLFPGAHDGHLSAHHVGKLLSGLMPAGWSMHKLRHRYASRGFAGTGNIRAVQEALGHASVATTQRYTAVAGRDVRSVSEAAA